MSRSKAADLGRVRAKTVQYAHAIIFGEVHLPDIFEMIIVEIGLDQRCKWLCRVDSADRHARLYSGSDRNLGSIKGPCALHRIKMLEDWPVVQADAHPPFRRKAN